MLVKLKHPHRYVYYRLYLVSEIFTKKFDMGGGDKPKTDREASQQEALHLEVFTDYERITPAQTDVTVLATVTAAPLASEERRAPITICAAIDRRYRSPDLV